MRCHMNNAEVSTREEIKNALTSGQAVESGYEVDYTFKDVIEECRDLEDILLEMSTSTSEMLEVHAYNVKAELMMALERVAIEIEESFHE